MIVVESVVRLILASDLYLHGSFLEGTFGMQYHHTGYGIAAIHERGRALQYFHRMHTLLVDFKSVLITPLLSFLSDTLVHDDHSVVAKATNDRLRDACSGTYLRQSRQVSNGIHNVGADGLVQRFGRYDHEGRGRILQSLRSGNALHRHFAQDGFLHRVDAVLQTVAVPVLLLGRDRHGDCPQADSYIYNNVFHNTCPPV